MLSAGCLRLKFMYVVFIVIKQTLLNSLSEAKSLLTDTPSTSASFCSWLFISLHGDSLSRIACVSFYLVYRHSNSNFMFSNAKNTRLMLHCMSSWEDRSTTVSRPSRSPYFYHSQETYLDLTSYCHRHTLCTFTSLAATLLLCLLSFYALLFSWLVKAEHKERGLWCLLIMADLAHCL